MCPLPAMLGHRPQLLNTGRPHADTRTGGDCKAERGPTTVNCHLLQLVFRRMQPKASLFQGLPLRRPHKYFEQNLLMRSCSWRNAGSLS